MDKRNINVSWQIKFKYLHSPALCQRDVISFREARWNISFEWQFNFKCFLIHRCMTKCYASISFLVTIHSFGASSISWVGAWWRKVLKFRLKGFITALAFLCDKCTILGSKENGFTTVSVILVQHKMCIFIEISSASAIFWFILMRIVKQHADV